MYDASVGQFLLLNGWQLVVLSLLLVFSAMVSACETGFFSLGSAELFAMGREGRPLGRMVASVMKMPRTLLTTVLLINNVLNILYFVISTLLLIQMEHEVRHGAVWSGVGAVASLLALVLFGEIIPKSVAYLYPRRLAEAAAPVILMLCRLVQPLHRFLAAMIVNPLTRLIAPPRSRRGDLTAEEMESLLTLSQKRGLIGKNETALLQEVLELTDLRAGNIMDLLSSSGLRIVCVKKFSMSVAQAEAFYGPVRESLKKVFPLFGKERAAHALAQEFGFPVDPAALGPLCDQLAPSFAAREFENIVEFMSGRRPSACTPEEKIAPGNEECLAIVYEGVAAVSKIRDILGSTDPRKARPGSIRREFGTNIMVNAAHASDSPENAVREMGIIDVEHDFQFEDLIRRYYP